MTLSISLVGYSVSDEAMERYRALDNLPDSNRLLVQDLQLKINVPARTCLCGGGGCQDSVRVLSRLLRRLQWETA